MAGPMAGTCLVIDDSVDEILIGSDPDCRLSLDLPGVSPIHARVWRDLGGITVYDTRSPRGLYVNDDRVVDQAALRDGDVLWLGAPGDADSVMIRCRLSEEIALGVLAPDIASSAPPDDPLPIEERPEPLDVESLLDSPQDDVPPVEAPPVLDLLAFEVPPAPVAEAPAPAAEAAAPAPPEDFVMDPAWGENDPIETAAAPPALTPVDDLDALLGDEPESPPPPAAEAIAPDLPPVVPLPPPPPPTPSTPTPPPTPPPAPPVRQQGGAPPLTPAPTPMATITAPDVRTPPAPAAPTPMATTPAPDVRTPPAPPVAAPQPQRAIIDDTRPRPVPRAAGTSSRREAADGVMDWAQAAPSSPEDGVPSVAPAAPPPRASRLPAARTGRGPLLPVAGALIVLAALAGGYFAWTASRTPRIEAVSPARATTGNVITLTGAYLGETAAATSVSVGGHPARIVQAGGGRLQIEVPELPTTPGRDIPVAVVVTAGGRESKPASVAVYQAPRLTSLVPEVAMPGENVVLAGTSLGAGAKVRFGDVEAQVVEATPGSVTVTVPALTVAPGAEVPVVAAMGADPSNALTMLVGKVPLLISLEPRSASPGDLVTAAGRGFNAQALANRVTVGGVPALVVNASSRRLEFVVPRVIAGGGTVAITVPGSTQVGQEEMSITVLPEPVGFRFVAEPFDDVPGHDHAAVATGLGPAFILSAAEGKSAAERAYEAQKLLNDAAQVLRSTRTAEIRARYEPAPAVYLVTRDTVLLDVTDADADAYNEDWTRSRATGAPVTAARLATWWEAVARDLVLLLLRGEKPTHAQAIAPEGKVLADLYDAARRTVAVGVPSALVAGARAPMRDALRAVALRVPATVTAPVTRAITAAPATADALPALKLDGTWRGSETESGALKPITMVFKGASGTLTYERALSMSVPIFAIQQPQKGAVRFEVRVGAGVRFYRGQWNGARITGKLTSDPEGRAAIGTFELDPVR